ncbi:MAG: ATP-binding protein [Pseudomonadota bacterium]
MTDKLIKLSWLEELYTLSQTAASATNLEDTLQAMLRHIADGFSAGSGTLAFMLRTEEVLEIVAGTDLPKEAIGQRIAMGQGILGRVAQSGQPILINGTLDAAQTSRPQGATARHVPSSSMCWPLLIKGHNIGVLSMNRFEAHQPFEDRDLQRGSIMANMLALVIENLRMHREQQQRISDLSELNRQMAEMNRKLADTQTQLIQNEKMASIGQLAAGVAHEINNPIGFVTSNLRMLGTYMAQLLQRASDAQAGQARDEDLEYLKEDVPTLLAETRDGLERVRRIVQDLRDFSRVDSSEQWEQADLNAALMSTVNVGLTEFKPRVSVECAFGELPPVQCLLSQLNQVFLNVILNAAQAIETAGMIHLRTGCEGPLAWVEVEDTGCGIPPENIDRIFEPFFTTRPIGKGTGLGLSLAYSIVQKHHGHIEIRSALGQGSCFRITLPVRQATPVA